MGAQVLESFLERAAAVAEVVHEVNIVRGELELALVCNKSSVMTMSDSNDPFNAFNLWVFPGFPYITMSVVLFLPGLNVLQGPSSLLALSMRTTFRGSGGGFLRSLSSFFFLFAIATFRFLMRVPYKEGKKN